MGGKGGGGGSSNNMAIQMQMQAAQEARMKEWQREQRLRQGEASINAEYDNPEKFQALYDKYETGQRDFYMPELQKQYGDARKKAFLAHAGAGTLWSSMRGDTEADIASQNALNKGQIESQIQDSVGGLRRQVASDKSSLINQLYATENPEMAANEALSRVRTISQQTPPLSPMGDLFKTAAIGLGNAFSNANNPYNKVTNPGIGRVSSGLTRYG
jgi:hypothetical protein